MLPQTFFGRLILLLSMFVVIAVFELLLRGRQAHRWQEYLFICGCAAAGAVFGMLHDLATLQISSLYFILGKWLPDDEFLVAHVLRLGAQAGCVAGVISGGILLMASHAQWPFRELYKPVLSVMLAAIACELCLALLSPWLPLSYPLLADIDTPMAEQQSFYRVWAMHIGLYVGAGLMLLLQAGLLFRNRRVPGIAD